MRHGLTQQPTKRRSAVPICTLMQPVSHWTAADAHRAAKAEGLCLAPRVGGVSRGTTWHFLQTQAQAYSVALSLRNGSGRHCIPAPLLHTGLMLPSALSAQMAWTAPRASPPFSYSRVPHVLTMPLQCACYKQRTNHL